MSLPRPTHDAEKETQQLLFFDEKKGVHDYSFNLVLLLRQSTLPTRANQLSGSSQAGASEPVSMGHCDRPSEKQESKLGGDEAREQTHRGSALVQQHRRELARYVWYVCTISAGTFAPGHAVV